VGVQYADGAVFTAVIPMQAPAPGLVTPGSDDVAAVPVTTKRGTS
jgi:hypothetical protein